MKEFVYLDEKYLKIEDAKISIGDRGFIFGDSLYEVIPLVMGVPIDLSIHLQRLVSSAHLTRINLDPGFAMDEIPKIIAELLRRNRCVHLDRKVYIQVSRGVKKKRQHAFGENLTPTVLIKLEDFERPAKIQEPMACILSPDIRWALRNIKATSLLANILLRQKAVDASAQEAILYDVRDGKKIVTEGSSCNIFIVDCKQRILTHPENERILAGVTRDRTIQLARANGLEVIEDYYTVEDLLTAQEVFATTSGFFIKGIRKIDKILVGSGKVGCITRKLERIFNDYVDKTIHNSHDKTQHDSTTRELESNAVRLG